MSKAEKAAETLSFYFKSVFQASGLRWSRDNDTEIENAVQDIIEAARTEPDAKPTIETHSEQTCPHCENGMVTPPVWKRCDAAMKAAGTHNTNAILAWFNDIGGSYATFSDLPDEEVKCPECGGRVEEEK